jgi:hypothetical protein
MKPCFICQKDKNVVLSIMIIQKVDLNTRSEIIEKFLHLIVCQYCITVLKTINPFEKKSNRYKSFPSVITKFSDWNGYELINIDFQIVDFGKSKKNFSITKEELLCQQDLWKQITN